MLFQQTVGWWSGEKFVPIREEGLNSFSSQSGFFIYCCFINQPSLWRPPVYKMGTVLWSWSVG